MKARLLTCLLLLAACSPQHRNSFSGYAEGDFLYMSPREAGELVTLNAVEGQEVAQGAPLFALDADRFSQAVDRAQAQYNSALAHLADLKAGLRPEEVRQLEAAAGLAQKTAVRARAVYAGGNMSKADLDQAEAALTQAKAALANAYGGRANQIEGASQDAQAAQTALATAQLDLADRTVKAPATGRVETIFHRPGEMIGAALPVLSFLPDGRLKALFFVGEDDLSRLKIGGAREDHVRCLRGAHRCRDLLHRRRAAVHAAGHLLPRGAPQARLPGRSAAGKRPSPRPADRREPRAMIRGRMMLPSPSGRGWG